MQLIYILLLLNSLFKTSTSSCHQNGKDKVVKNKGRLSRVTWLLHENENSLDHRIFEDDDRMKERTNSTMHYKKRKYNVKVEHKRKDKLFQNTSKKHASVSRKKETVVTRRKLYEVEIKENKIKMNKKTKVNLGTTELRTVPNAKEFNNIETDGIIKDLRKDVKDKNKSGAKNHFKVLMKVPRRYGKQENEKIAQYRSKLTPQSYLQRKPNTLYMKNAAKELILMRDQPKIMLHSKYDPKQRNNAMNWKNGEFMSALNYAPLANPPKQMQVKTPMVHDDDNTHIADELSKKVRVLCWVMTHPSNHNTTCQPIKDTWGKRCNKLLFMSTVYDPTIPTVKLNVQEGRGFLWPKVKAALRYVYDNYHDQYDWFVRSDDDTFLVVENLRYLLADFDPRDPIYFGCRFRPFSSQGFMSGGASIPLSKGALERVVSYFGDSDICKVDIDEDLEADDVNLGICLSRIGVKAVDSRDVAHKGRFMVFSPQDHLSPVKLTDKSFWYWKYVYYPTEIGEGCCSDYAISFHYVAPEDMYALEYLIYRIRPFGIQHGDGPLPGILVKQPSQKKTAKNYKTKLIEENKATEIHDATTVPQIYANASTEFFQYVDVESDVNTSKDYQRIEKPPTEAQMSTNATYTEFHERTSYASNVST